MSARHLWFQDLVLNLVATPSSICTFWHGINLLVKTWSNRCLFFLSRQNMMWEKNAIYRCERFIAIWYWKKMCNVDFSSSLNIFIDFLQKWSLFLIWQPCCSLLPRTTDTQWRHKSKISENLGWCGRQNMLRPYLNIWDWDWIFGRAVKAISSLGVRSPCSSAWNHRLVRLLRSLHFDK